MPSIKRFAVFLAAAAVAAALGGCAGMRPGSIDENLWFDKATGYDIIPVQPVPRYPPSAYGT